MKKRVLSMLLVSILLITQVTVLAKDYSDYPQRFWDVPKDHWAFEYISELVDKNVLSGYEDGSYRPEETVTRAEWSKMMVVASGKQEVKLNNNGSYAVDYNSNDWYYGYINAVVDYMNFYNESDGTYFKPNQAVSREDVTVSLVKLKGYNTDNVDYSVVMKFKDNASISNSIKKYVAVGVEKGLISGYEDNTFRGQDTLTRAEAATLLCRAFQMGNDNKTNNNPDVVNPDENNNSNSNTSNDTQNDVNNNGNGNTNVSNNDENKEDKKEYKVETLAKANVTTFKGADKYQAFYTQDNNNNLYYYDNDTHDIVKINMLTKEQEILENSNTLTVEYDGQEYSNMTIESMFYDSYVDSLVVYGYFSGGKNTFEQKADDFYCLVELNNLNVITFSDKFAGYAGDSEVYVNIENYGFYSVLNNGDYLVYDKSNSDRKYILNRNTFDRKQFGETNGSSEFYVPFQEYNGELYFIGCYGHPTNVYLGYGSAGSGLYKFTDSSYYGNDVEYRISKLPFSGIMNNKAYVYIDNCFQVYTLDGELLKTILYEDIEIKDNNNVDDSQINWVLMATTNDDIVFYDTWTKSFRIISKND